VQVRCSISNSAFRQGFVFAVQFPHGELLGTVREPTRSASPRHALVRHAALMRWSARAARILIVDDDVVLLRALARALDRAGWLVTDAASGEAGLQALERSTFDVIIADFKMPDVDGRTVLAAARCSSPNSVRVIMTAADVEPAHVFAQRLASKPIAPAELCELVEDALMRA
jgi:CheY-like chemotaxis protein